MKRVVVPGPRRVLLEDVPEPQRKRGEALLRVKYVGICGTDLHTYRGVNPYAAYPIVPGHELCCEVLECDGEFGSGDVVVVEPLLACGRCYPCTLGRYNCCERLKVLGVHTDGGMAEQIALPAKLLHRLPEDADTSCGPLIETLSIGHQACARGRIAGDDKVIVLGGGPIGLGAALVAKEKGAMVGIVDKLESRVKLALELGLDGGFQAGTEVEAHVVECFGSRPTVVVEAVGKAETLELSLELVSAAGRVVVVGLSGEAARVRPDLIIRKELDVVASRNSRAMFPDTIRFFREHQKELRRIVTDRFKMDDVPRAMKLMDTAQEDVMKIVVEW